MIRVRFPLPCQDEHLTHASLTHDLQQSGLRQAWARLRRRISKALPEMNGEKIGGTTSLPHACNWKSDYVSPLITSPAEPSVYDVLIAELFGLDPSKGGQAG